MAWANFLALGAPVLIWSLARIDRAGLGGWCSTWSSLLAPCAALRPRLVRRGRDQLWLRFAFSAVAGLGSLAWFWWRFGGRFLGFFAHRQPVQESSAQDR
jgi:hypothetical protein